MICLGIDFGTENTKVAFFNSKTNKIVSIPFWSSVDLFLHVSFPSVVFFNEVGLPKYFGATALEAGKAKPHLLVNKIKRVIGKTFEQVIEDPVLADVGYEIIAGKLISSEGCKIEAHEAKVRVGELHKIDYYPEEITAMIINAVFVEANDYIRNYMEHGALDYDRIIISYPAYFNHIQISKLRQAAIKQGFNQETLELINEPCAAVLDAVFEGKIPITSIDMFYVIVLYIDSNAIDFALVEVRPPIGIHERWRATTVAASGDFVLGGADVDKAIVEWIIEEIKTNSNVNELVLSKTGKQKLLFSAEDAKIAISEGRCRQTHIDIPGFEELGPMLTFEKLNCIVEPIVSRYLATFNYMLERYKIKDSEYKNIILTCESTSMPIIHNLISTKFAAPKLLGSIDPIMCIARGAAVSAFRAKSQ
jgi:molecular chaperone DnaK